VRENLVATASATALRTGDASQARWTLDRVLQMFPGLRERLDNMGNSLSGGEQQMLAVGRALLTNPRLLVLDEATEGLAPLVRAEIWRCLGELKSAGQGVVAIEVLDLGAKRFPEDPLIAKMIGDASAGGGDPAELEMLRSLGYVE